MDDSGRSFSLTVLNVCRNRSKVTSSHFHVEQIEEDGRGGRQFKAPFVILPAEPCQPIVHPPHWSPMSLAWAPTTRILLAFLLKGRMFFTPNFAFFRRTSDFRTASRAISLCACNNKSTMMRVSMMDTVKLIHTKPM
jgi:hypothetical protein